MSSIHETMLTLWNRAEDTLTVTELDAIAAEEEDSGSGWLSDPEGRASMLWGIAAQAAAIDALVTVGSRARARSDDLLGWTIDAQLAARKRLEAAQSDGKDTTPKARRRPASE